jgi:hypothetical protein
MDNLGLIIVKKFITTKENTSLNNNRITAFKIATDSVEYIDNNHHVNYLPANNLNITKLTSIISS